MEPFIRTCKCWPTNTNLSTTALYGWEDLPEAMDDREEWQERERESGEFELGFFGLVSLFNGISTLFRLFNAKAILLEEQ